MSKSIEIPVELSPTIACVVFKNIIMYNSDFKKTTIRKVLKKINRKDDYIVTRQNIESLGIAI